MAQKNLVRGSNIGSQSSPYSVDLNDGDFSIVNIQDIEFIGITLKTLTAGEVKVYTTDDESQSVWAQEKDSSGANPFTAGGVRAIIENPACQSLKIEAVGGNAEISLSLKNA